MTEKELDLSSKTQRGVKAAGFRRIGVEGTESIV